MCSKKVINYMLVGDQPLNQMASPFLMMRNKQASNGQPGCNVECLLYDPNSPKYNSKQCR